MSRSDSDHSLKYDKVIKDTESDNLYEDWLKSSSDPSPERAPSSQTIIVKSVAQSYQEMFKNIYIDEDNEKKDSLKPMENSNIASTAMSFGSPKEHTGSVIEIKELSRTFYGSIAEQPQESDKDDNEEFTMVYCNYCQKCSYPIVTVRIKELSLWKSVKFLMNSLRCCSIAEDLKEYQEYIYSCSICRDVVFQRPIIIR
ncbi:hypothetical protein SteCoe_355 [Stentor coeruleus]|uniref:LITAF domain-containing protein n=1 Tax=Stentor coeruleus TaxID=5963 RepID=A0A1R2D4I0_9CILI|nr:hypothetical protein SteCoe_355 [Stentor coeruleus]